MIETLAVTPYGETKKWLWIELIGFDNTKSDYGIEAFINNLSFLPEGISLLLYSIDFVNLHMEGLPHEKDLAPCHCSYLAHPFNEDRARQNWTNYQLKDFIRALKEYGIKVYMSFFNTFTYNDDNGNLTLEEYSRNHTEIWDVTRDGTKTYYINVLKRLSSGEFYEDYFIEKTVQALRDYGFDGFQAADGISSARKSLQESDYSDDLVGQFVANTTHALTAEIEANCDGDSKQFLARAKFIWNNMRLEWIDFHVSRWNTYFVKLIDAVHSACFKILYHSAWTRDPFESIYRYGMDYKKVAQAGADMFLVNEVSTGVALLSDEDNGYHLDDDYRRKLHYEYTSMLMLIRAYAKNSNLLTLAGIKDITEDFDILHHCPTSMWRDVYTNLNTCIYDKNGISPCISGVLFCLSDGLKKDEWEYITKIWKTGYTPNIKHSEGVSLVWSDNRMRSEFEYFINTRGWHTHKIIYELLNSGLSINSVVDINDLSFITGPVLITNPGLMTKLELDIINNYKGGECIYFGKPISDNPGREADLTVGFSIFSSSDKTQNMSNNSEYDIKHLNADQMKVEDEYKGLWTCPLSYASVDKGYMDNCVKSIYNFIKIPRVIKRESSCKIICIKLSDDRTRILVGNDDYYYNHPIIDMGRKIKTASVMSKYYGYNAAIDGNTICLKVPGRGMDIIDVEFQEGVKT